MGVSADAERVDWLFTPISKVLDLVDATRQWFQETHPGPAQRFFPFIDWSNGDATGYLLSPSGALLSALFDFEHEEYTFDASQDESEFLTSAYGSIEELLQPDDV